MNMIRIIILLVFLVGLSACGAEKEPTVVIFPTLTLTPAEVSPTPTPTATPYLSPTPSPTIATATPSITRDPNVEPTSPFRATHTPAPATQTATFLPTRIGLSIEYFTTNVERVTPGEPITLFWRVNGATSAQIIRLNIDGERDRLWQVDLEGRLTVSTDPEVQEGVRFILEALTSNNSVEEELTISTECSFSWFFIPQPNECPTDAPLATFQVEQPFERGFMFWLQEQGQIYVIYDDGQEPTWERYEDQFQDGDPDLDESLQPPAGLLQPVRGFGFVWRENPSMQERLGWAFSPEVGYDGIIQIASGELENIYLRTIDGGILQLQADGLGWEVLLEQITVDLTPTVETATPSE